MIYRGGLCLVLLTVFSVLSAYAGDLKYEFDIPATDAKTGLNRLVSRTNSSLLYRDSDINNLRINAVKGVYTLSEALTIMFRGTGVTGTVSDKGVLTITVSASAHPAGKKIASEKKQKHTFFSRLAAWLKPTLTRTSGINAQEITEPMRNFLEEVVVTGSHIKQRSGMNTPVPVTAVAGDELDSMAPGDMIEGISQLPQFFGNQTPNSPESWFLRGGYGNLNMRGLGINRTLTLFNGRRLISSTVFGGIDINVIPESMIRSIETVTGGASAAYGTDAVAGVTNFLLDTSFTGFKASLQGGITSRGDSKNYEGSLAYGMALGERGHLLVSGEKFRQDGVHNYQDRDWYQGWGTVPDANGMLRVVPNVVSKGSSFDGIIFAPGSALNGQAFDRNGNTSPYIVSDISYGQAGAPQARQSITNGGSGDDLGAEVQTIYPDVDRNSEFVYLDYDFTDNLKVFAQGIRGQNKTFRFNDQRGALQGTPTTITIFQDNAFLPAAVRQTMINEGLASFTLRRKGSAEDIGTDINQWDNSVMYSVTGGFNYKFNNGGFLDSWSLDGYYQYGENTRKWYQKGLRVDRIFAAADAVDDGTGNIVCRVTLMGSTDFPGCTPINLFGRGNASAAAVDYVTNNEPGEQITTPLYFADTGFASGDTISYISDEAKVNITKMTQHIFELSANGEIYEGWGAGPISLAVGGSYRSEEVLQVVHDSTNESSNHDTGHPVLCNGESPGLRGVSPPDCANTVGIQYSKVSNIKGRINVTEAFAETLVPLIADGALIKKASLDMAARWADYSGSGSIWAYKFGLNAQLTDSFRVRGTYSRDVRAANLSERFDKTGNFTTVTDPRYNETYNVIRYSGGNPEVKPEKADTFTAGFVYQPAYLEGLSLSLDWYQVQMKGAIGQLGTQSVVNQCEAGAKELCALVTRNPVDDRLILVGDVYINIDQEKVSGVDLEAAYHRDVDWFSGRPESIQARIFATWLGERSETLAGASKVDRAGQTGIQQSDGVAYSLPKYKWTANVSYNNGPFTAFLQGRYIGSGKSENALVEGVNIDNNSVDSAFYTDVTLSYDFKLGNGISMEVFANATNLLDKDPPVTPYYSVFLGYAQQTNPGLFDVLGRRFTAGVRLSL
jgi:outer membrane receptor protein involved in Fe transport